MARWPKDNQAALIAFYGDPGARNFGSNLVRVTPPFQMYYDGQPLKTVSFHKKAAPALLRALERVWNHYGRDQRVIDKLGISKTAGTYNPRKVRGSATKWSNHAYGAAIDINAEQNGFNVAGNIPIPMIAAFKAEGARWGGDYRSRKDPMHFEFCDGGEPQRTFEEWLKILGAPKAVGFADLPEEEPQGDAHDHEHDAAPVEPTDEPEEKKPGFFRRIRNWATGLGTGGGLFGLGYMTDWQVVLVLCAFVFLAVAAVVGFTIWFMGADRVRQWARKQFR